MKYDTIIIGGGIVGLSTAFQILESDPELNVAVLEKEDDLAAHQSSHNSGVMHSGIYYTPGSLRARNCLHGHQLLQDFCGKYDVPFEICGKLIVASDSTELEKLHLIYERGKKNGLQGLKLIEPDEAREIEPHVACVKSIYVPSAGITSYRQVAHKMAEIFRNLGGIIHCQSKVNAITENPDGVHVDCGSRSFTTTHLITCAGLFADKITRMTIPDCPYQVIPFRGEYFELKKEKEYLVNHLIYPLPNDNFPFLGVHFTRMVEGGIEAGPNAVFAFQREGYHHSQFNLLELGECLTYRGFQRLASKYWRVGLQEMRRSYSKSYFVKAMQKLIPSISSEDVVRGRSGVRAMVCDTSGELIDDFLILETKRVINVLNAPSPAATASLAIGKEIIHKWKQKRM